MQVYVSCPLGVPMDKIKEVGCKLNTMGYHPWWYERGTTYMDSMVKVSEMFVLMSEHNKFDYILNDMTAGCRKELELAMSLKKQLYMAYWKNGKTLNIYPINPAYLLHGRVLGQSGSYLQVASKVINNYDIY